MEWRVKRHYWIGESQYTTKHVKRCRGKDCGKLIVWAINGSKRWNCFDIDTGDPHWATCANAAEFRKEAKD